MSEAQDHLTLDWDIADRLRKALRYADVSVGEMAEDLGVSRNTVGRYINGHVTPDYRTLRLWALRCGVPLAWLMGDEGLPRVDSNHQPAGWLTDTEPLGTAEVKAMAKTIVDEEFRRRIRHGHKDHRTITNIGNVS